MTITAKCSCCGRMENYRLTDKEEATFKQYQKFGRGLGRIQDLFPTVPAWIRAGAIDQTSGGFCICPECGSTSNEKQKRKFKVVYDHSKGENETQVDIKDGKFSDMVNEMLHLFYHITDERNEHCVQIAWIKEEE